MKWGKARLDDVCDLITCGVAKRPEYVDEGVPFLSSTNVKANRFLLDSYRFVSIKDYQLLTKHNKPCRGDILYTRVGSFGEAAVIDLDIDFAIFVSLTLIKPKKEYLDSRFLMWYLNSPKVRAIAAHSTSGIGVQNLNVGVVREFQVPVPPLPVQKQIAYALDKADALRKKDEQLLQKHVELEQAIFYEMFGNPVHNSRRWTVKRFADVGTLDRGVSKHRPRNAPELLGGPYPLIQTGDIANAGGYIRSYKQTYSEAGLKQSKLWKAGTLCITIAATIAKTTVLTFDACFPDSVVGFVPGEEVTINYVRYWLGHLQKTLEDTAPESAQKNINLEILRNLSIPVPPVELQQRFESRILNLENHKSLIKQSKRTSDMLFESITSTHF